MSVFWTQQMFNLFGLGGSGSWDRSTKAFDNVTDATANEMGDTLRAVFSSGDTLQRGMVDLFLAPLGLVNWNGASDRENGRRAGSDRSRSENGGRRGSGWADAAAGFAQAGADIVQAAADTTVKATRRASQAVVDQAPPQSGATPRSSDPSLGWGPMP